MKTASDIYSPVTGQVTDVNAAVVKEPALVNNDPYGEGWFFKVKLAGQPAAGLLSAEQYQGQVGS